VFAVLSVVQDPSTLQHFNIVFLALISLSFNHLQELSIHSILLKFSLKYFVVGLLADTTNPTETTNFKLNLR
jgi:hypothetical protein